MEKNKKHSFRPLQWLKRMLGLNRRELSFAEEEALQSPLRMIIKKFFANKLSRFGFITFVLVFLFVMLGPYFVKIDLSHQDNTQLNVPPGYNMMRVPKELNGKIRKIAPGTTFALGVSEEGRLFLWGQSKITDQIDLKNIPKELNDVHIVDIAVGYDHAVALDEKGKLYTWETPALDRITIPRRLPMPCGKMKIYRLRRWKRAASLLSRLIAAAGCMYGETKTSTISRLEKR